MLALNNPPSKENTSHQQSMCQQTALRFWASLRQTFPNSVAFILINKSGKGAAPEISSVFGTVYHVTCQRVFWKATF